MEWIPRSGEVGCVMRGYVKDYQAMPGISTWHRFVAMDNDTEEGVLHVSELSCFCTACQNYQWAKCPFIADTGPMTKIKPKVDTKDGILAIWSIGKAVQLATKLEVDDWVIWHVGTRTKENRRMFGDHDWALGKYAGPTSKGNKTSLTDGGTMIKVRPYRTSQLESSFIQQHHGTTCFVDITELLVKGLDVKITKLKHKRSKNTIGPGDKQDADMVSVRQTTLNLVSVKLERWAKTKK